jgi:hypothetical protein
MRLAGVAFLAAAGLLAGGCGDGDGDGRLSAAELRERANAICREYDERIENLGEPGSLEEVPEFVNEAIPIIEEGLAELRELEPPEDLEADYDRMLDETEKSVGVAERLRDAAAEGSQQAVRDALEEGNAADSESDRIARELGLEECADESDE